MSQDEQSLPGQAEGGTTTRELHEELQDTNERYRLLVSQISQGLWRTALKKPLSVNTPVEEQIAHIYKYSFIAECNDAMAQMYGYSHAEELIGKHRNDFMVGDDPRNHDFLRNYILFGYRQVDAESHEIDRYGTHKFFLNNNIGIIRDGMFLGTWGIQRDITERKEAQMALLRTQEDLEKRILERTSQLEDANAALRAEIAEHKESQRRMQSAEAKYRSLVERVLGIVYLSEFGAQGKFFYVGPQIESVLGYTVEEWMRDPNVWYSSLHPEDRSRVLAEEERSWKTGQPFVSEYRVFNREGNEIWLRDEAAVIEDSSGERRLQGVMHNITEEKRGEIRNLAFTSLGQSLNTAKNPREAAVVTIEIAGKLIGWDSCFFDLYSADEDKMIPLLNMDTIAGTPQTVEATSTSGPPGSASRRAMNEGAFLLSGSDASHLQRFGDNARASASRMYVPIRSGQKVIGVMSIQSYKENAYGKSELEILSTLGDFCGGALERLFAEDQLRQSEQRFSLAFHSNPAAISISNLDGILIDINPSYEHMTGFSRSELIGKTAIALGLYLQPTDRTQIVKNLLKEKSLRDVQVPVRTKSGEIRYILGSYVLIQLHGVDCLLGMFHDITGRLRAEESLMQLASIVESSDDAIVSIGLDGKIISWNSAAERLYQYKAEEAKGNTLTSLFPSERRDQLSQIVEHAMNGEGILNFETLQQRKDGTRMDVSLTVSAIKSASGHVIGASCIARDVTELKELQDQLAQARRIETIGQLAGGVAHDFNNILMAISSYCELIRANTPDDDARMRDLNEIAKAVDQGASLTQQLLAFGRKQIMDSKILDLNHVLSQMENMLRRLIGENIEALLLLDPQLGRIKADPGQIKQVLMNLAINSRDAMPSGGSLKIRTRNAVMDESFIRAHAGSVAGRYIALDVEDTGSGMEREILSRIFEPFFTTKEKGKGTGLGLSTVYGIVKQSGGYITVESEPRRGTKFTIYFPRVDEMEYATSNPPADVPEDKFGHTILLVDDNEPVRNALKALLTMQGFQVLLASDGREALEQSKNYIGTIDLLITDVIMPRMSGRELAKGVSEDRPDLKILFISGYTDDLITDLSAGYEFLQKPLTMDSLMSKIRELFGS